MRAEKVKRRKLLFKAVERPFADEHFLFAAAVVVDICVLTLDFYKIYAVYVDEL